MKASKKPHPLDDKYDWHNWFAWFPTYVNNDDVRAIVWMETIQRRRVMAPTGRDFCWEYQLPG